MMASQEACYGKQRNLKSRNQGLGILKVLLLTEPLLSEARVHGCA